MGLEGRMEGGKYVDVLGGNLSESDNVTKRWEAEMHVAVQRPLGLSEGLRQVLSSHCIIQSQGKRTGLGRCGICTAVRVQG